jgi:hypothetical protein
VIAQAVVVVASPPILGVQIAALQPSQVAHPFIERADAQLCIRITGGELMSTPMRLTRSLRWARAASGHAAAAPPSSVMTSRRFTR